MIIAFLLLFVLQITPEIREHIDAGLKAKAAGDLTTAAREFGRVADLAPNMAAAHVNLGAVYYAQKDYAKAIPSLRRAVEIDPALPGAHAMLGAALLAQGFARESIPHLEKAQADDLLGVAFFEAGQPDEALKHLEAAFAKRPNDPDLLFYLGQAHAQLSRDLFDKLRAGNPDSARTHQVLGDALAAAGRRDAAIEHFRAALASRPDLHGVHYSIGEIFLEADDFYKAEAEFREEARLVPGSAAAAFKWGVALANLGRTAEAIEQLRRANSLQPDMPETLLELGKALNASGDAKGAETFLLQALKSEQDTPLAGVAHIQLSQVYRKLGRPKEAAEHLKAFQELRGR